MVSHFCQWFRIQPAFFPCYLNQKHLIQIISSLVETPRPESGVSDKGEMQNVQCWGTSRNMVGNLCPSLYTVYNTKTKWKNVIIYILCPCNEWALINRKENAFKKIIQLHSWSLVNNILSVTLYCILSKHCFKQLSYESEVVQYWHTVSNSSHCRARLQALTS